MSDSSQLPLLLAPMFQQTHYTSVAHICVHAHTHTPIRLKYLQHVVEHTEAGRPELKASQNYIVRLCLKTTQFNEPANQVKQIQRISGYPQMHNSVRPSWPLWVIW